MDGKSGTEIFMASKCPQSTETPGRGSRACQRLVCIAGRIVVAFAFASPPRASSRLPGAPRRHSRLTQVQMLNLRTTTSSRLFPAACLQMVLL
jgi:hypothetical protein